MERVFSRVPPQTVAIPAPRINKRVRQGVGIRLPCSSPRLLSAFGSRSSCFPPSAFRLGLRLSVFGFRTSAFGLRPSAFGLRLSVFGFRLSVFGFRLSVFGFRHSALCSATDANVLLAPYWFSAFGLRFRTSATESKPPSDSPDHVSARSTKVAVSGFKIWMWFCAAGAKVFAPSQKWAKREGFVAKHVGRRGTLEEDLQRCMSHGRRSTRDMLIRDVRRSGRWFPESGRILVYFGASDLQLKIRDAQRQPERGSSKMVKNGKAGCYTLPTRITGLRCVNSEVHPSSFTLKRAPPSGSMALSGSMAKCRSHHGNHTRQELDHWSDLSGTDSFWHTRKHDPRA